MDTIMTILMWVLVAVLLIAFAPVLLPLAWDFIKWLVTLPVKLVKWLVGLLTKGT